MALQISMFFGIVISTDKIINYWSYANYFILTLTAVSWLNFAIAVKGYYTLDKMLKFVIGIENSHNMPVKPVGHFALRSKKIWPRSP